VQALRPADADVVALVLGDRADGDALTGVGLDQEVVSAVAEALAELVGARRIAEEDLVADVAARSATTSSASGSG
jgi:hypothetical protein